MSWFSWFTNLFSPSMQTVGGIPTNDHTFTFSESLQGTQDPNDGVVISGTSSPFPRFANKVDIWFPTPDLVNHDEAFARYTGYAMPVGNQEFGPCCTAYSTCDMIKLAHAVSVVRKPKPWIAKQNPSIPHIYALSRCNVVGDRIGNNTPNNNPDGSSQYACLLAAKNLGLLPCAKYPWGDMTTYDPQMCTSFISLTRPRPWARFGVPAASMSSLVPLNLDVCHVYTEQEAISALAHGFVLGVQTKWYFTQTLANGMILATMLTGNVGHAMSLQGYKKRKNDETLFCVRNQMGQKIFSGKNDPAFPVRGTGLTPHYSFRADLRTRVVPMMAVGSFANVQPAALRK